MSDKKKTIQPDGSIPKTLLNQLSEHTTGGFVLFYFNSEDGSLEHACNFDSPMCAAALQKYVSDWSAALDDISIENIKSHFCNAIEEPPDTDKTESV